MIGVEYAYDVIIQEKFKICALSVLQEMKVNWATSPSNQPKQDTSSKYSMLPSNQPKQDTSIKHTVLPSSQLKQDTSSACKYTVVSSNQLSHLAANQSKTQLVSMLCYLATKHCS